MITIVAGTPKDFEIIRAIAYQTWPATYGKILSKAQLDYMLAKFYSEESLNINLAQQNHHFLLVKENEITVGFASYEHHYHQKSVTRIHKIYILPQTQGKGFGKILMDHIEQLALQNNNNYLSLNVNRFNKALRFYQKIGFEIIAEEDIALDFGYLMEDYVLQKPL